MPKYLNDDDNNPVLASPSGIFRGMDTYDRRRYLDNVLTDARGAAFRSGAGSIEEYQQKKKLAGVSLVNEGQLNVAETNAGADIARANIQADAMKQLGREKQSWEGNPNNPAVGLAKSISESNLATAANTRQKTAQDKLVAPTLHDAFKIMVERKRGKEGAASVTPDMLGDIEDFIRSGAFKQYFPDTPSGKQESIGRPATAATAEEEQDPFLKYQGF